MYNVSFSLDSEMYAGLNFALGCCWGEYCRSSGFHNTDETYSAVRGWIKGLASYHTTAISADTSATYGVCVLREWLAFKDAVPAPECIPAEFAKTVVNNVGTYYSKMAQRHYEQLHGQLLDPTNFLSRND